MVQGNVNADGEAGKRVNVPASVLQPVGGERYYITHGGKTVTQETGSYIREHGRQAALIAWGDETKRGQQGAVARTALALHKGTLDLRRVCRVAVADDIARGVSVGSAQALENSTWKNRQSVGGAWTSKLKVGNPEATEYVTRTAQGMHAGQGDGEGEDTGGGATQGQAEYRDMDMGADLGVDESEEDDPEVDLSRECPLCGEGHGTLRHVLLRCSHPDMVALRKLLFVYVEKVMRNAATMATWIRASACAMDRGGACIQKSGWESTTVCQSFRC
jgi:hypothetical protein